MSGEIIIIRGSQDNPDYDNFRELAKIYDNDELEMMKRKRLK